MIRWTGNAFLGTTRAELVKRFTKAGVYSVSKLRGYLNRSQKYVRLRGGKKFVGLDPSAPGEFPKKLTGQLQRSITWELDQTKLILSVGSNLKPYPKFLQTGTRIMHPRPWLSNFFNLERDNIGKILAK